MSDFAFLRAARTGHSRTGSFAREFETQTTSHAPRAGDFSLGGPTIFRRAPCPCGGGCPSCSVASSGLKMSSPTDLAESEADRIADRVTGKRGGVNADKPASPPSIQPNRSSETGAQQIPDNLGTRINSSRGGGSSLDTGTRAYMEARFGADFSRVRIHTGKEAAEMSHDVGAQAFTLGNDIYFGQGKCDAATPEGRSLIAHELAHTVQYGPASNTVHRKIDIEAGLELPTYAKYFKRTDFKNRFTYDEPIRDKTLELEIVTSMLTSPRIFKVAGKTGDAAETSIASHVNARIGVVDLAKNKRYKFAGGQSGFRMNPTYWTWGGGTFKSKPGVNLNEARADIGEHPEEYVIGCAAATQLTVKGGARSESTSSTTTDEKDWIPGEAGFIENPGWDKEDNGLQGENIIYTGAKQFWGHFESQVAIKPYKEWFAQVKSWNKLNKREPQLSQDRTYPVKGLDIT